MLLALLLVTSISLITIDYRGGERSPLDGVRSFAAAVVGPVEPVEIQVDQARSTVAVQSWYAGVHVATACPAGTRVTHRVHRVLPDHPGFAAGIAEIDPRTRMSRDLRQVPDVIADRLGCRQSAPLTRAGSA